MWTWAYSCKCYLENRFLLYHSTLTLLHIFSRSRAFNIPPNQRNSHLIDYLGLRAIRLKGNQIAYAHYPERNLHQTRHTRTHTPTLEARYLRVKFCAEFFFCVCILFPTTHCYVMKMKGFLYGLDDSLWINSKSMEVFASYTICNGIYFLCCPR